jgi:catechol 2,3-dioxygenase-like lactoylglutathione lyase family enzyme
VEGDMEQQEGAAVSVSLTKIGVITVFVEELEESKAFYQKVFGLAPIFEDDASAVFSFENLAINLLVTSAAGELIEPATVASPESGSRFQFTIPVDSVDAACAELEKNGVTLLNGPMNRVWGVRTASFTDPGGHIWEIAEGIG